MALQLQLRRGTTTEHSSFKGAVGEVTVDTSKNTLVLHDGVTAGGFPLTSSGTKIPANANLNNYKTVGLYFCDTDTTTILNNPTQYGFSLFVEKVSDTAVNQKLVVHKDGGGKIYIRSFSTSWSDWNTVPFEKDVLGGTYKNVTSSRLPAVTYTNTSGKTIVIYVVVIDYNNTYSTGASGVVNGFVVADITGSLGGKVSFSMVVPNNSTYRYYNYSDPGVFATVLELS